MSSTLLQFLGERVAGRGGGEEDWVGRGTLWFLKALTSCKDSSVRAA